MNEGRDGSFITGLAIVLPQDLFFGICGGPDVLWSFFARGTWIELDLLKVFEV